MGLFNTWKDVMLSSKSKSFLKVLAILLAVPGILIATLAYIMGSGYGDVYDGLFGALIVVGAYLLVLLLLWSIVLLILYLKQKKDGVN